MTTKVRRRLRYLFIFLAVFALMQLCWWVYIMLDQQSLIASLVATQDAINEKNRFTFMILTEGVFWFVLWCAGLWAVYKTVKQERVLLMAHRDFLSSITHELKTPIANIQLSLESMKRHELTAEKRLVFINRALDATEKLHNEIINILSLNQQASLEQKNQEEFKILTVIEEVIEELDNDSFHKVNWQISVPPDLEILTQRGGLKIVFKAIIENAAKYSCAAVELEELDIVPTVLIAFEEGKLYISDNGIGFDEKEQENLFVEFYRGSLAKKLAVPGSGVGLSLAKQIANKLKIDMSIESPGKNKGCSVRLEF